jgi:hypothetical protein
MIGTTVEQNKDFINEINIVVKSMIYIHRNRHAFFTNHIHKLSIVDVEYDCSNNDNEDNGNNYYDNFNFDYTVKIKNTFFKIGKNSVSLQNEYDVLSGNESILKGLLNDDKSRNSYKINEMISYALRQPNFEKKILKHKKNMSIISKSYLSVYLFKFFKGIPEEIIIMILLYI